MGSNLPPWAHGQNANHHQYSPPYLSQSWRAIQQPLSMHVNAAQGRVGSWRSYRSDATNLQTITAPTSNLSATAASFQPVNSQFKSYEPLRVSNGTAERNAVQAANHKNGAKDNNKSPKQTRQPPSKLLQRSAVQPSPETNRRYNLRSNSGTADQPLPSIEPNENVITINTRSLPIRFTARGAIPPWRNPESRTKSPEAPECTDDYRSAADKKPVRLTEPRKLLVILDLNGTLLYRNGTSRSVTNIRPGVIPFLDYLFDNHIVMIYTSATMASAQKMLNNFLHPNHRGKLAALWSREQLGLTKAQYNSKVQVYKQLDKVWADKNIQQSAGSSNTWDQSNTILIDDSLQKAAAQPHNLLQVPEYKQQDDPAKLGKNHVEYKRVYKLQQDIITQLQLKIDELTFQEDVSRLIKRWQDGKVRAPHVTGQEVIVEETVDQKNLALHEASILEQAVRTHLPTPDSLDDGEGQDEDNHVSVENDLETRHSRRGQCQSVSPIDESVFRELLEGTGK